MTLDYKYTNEITITVIPFHTFHVKICTSSCIYRMDSNTSFFMCSTYSNCILSKGTFVGIQVEAPQKTQASTL